MYQHLGHLRSCSKVKPTSNLPAQMIRRGVVDSWDSRISSRLLPSLGWQALLLLLTHCKSSARPSKESLHTCRGQFSEAAAAEADCLGLWDSLWGSITSFTEHRPPITPEFGAQGRCNDGQAQLTAGSRPAAAEHPAAPERCPRHPCVVVDSGPSFLVRKITRLLKTHHAWLI